MIDRDFSKAKRAFENRSYALALQLYNELILKYPDNLKAKIGILLCDIAKDNEEQAQKLFEYYNILKKKNVPEAEKNVLHIIDALDKSANNFVAMINSIEQAKIDDIDGILYDDFKRLMKDDSFKNIFISAAFNTKIIFTKKNDFYEFLNLLVKNDLSDIAVQYIEILDDEIIYDKKIQAILNKALKSNDN